MKSVGRGLTGLLVVLVGLFFLAANLGWLRMGTWELLSRYWPVFLIAAGLVVLVGGRLGTFVVVVLAAVVIVWLFAGPWIGGRGITLEHTVIESAGAEPEVSVLRADVNLAAARVSTAGPGGRLFSVSVDHRPGGVSHSYSSSAGTGHLQVDTSLGLPVNLTTGRTPQAILEFRDGVALDLDLNLTAGEADLDLRRYDVKRLAVHGGAGRIKITFGEVNGQVESRASITTGEVEVWVPRNVPLRVWGQVTIGEREFSSAGLTRVDGYWQDEAYGNATSRIDLELEAKIGRVVLKRY